MAKQQPNTRESETPFHKFERLARKLAAVPKREADRVKRKEQERKSGD